MQDFLTCGLGLVHDLTLVCFPPPQVTGTMAPAAFSLNGDSYVTSTQGGVLATNMRREAA